MMDKSGEAVDFGSLDLPSIPCTGGKSHIWSDWVTTEDYTNENGQRIRTYTSNCGVCNATKYYYHYSQEETK